MKEIATAIILLLFALSCTNNPVSLYSLSNFSNELRPHLEKIISKGISGNDSAVLYLEEHATPDELNKLSRSEHPVLRMVTLRILQERDSLDQFSFMMNHLNDTALIPVDEGEFGVNFKTIPDFLLENGKWKSIEDKNKMVDKVLLNHNYLKSAYYILPHLELKEKHYLAVSQMARRDRPFHEIEYALYGLAQFRKRKDIAFLKKTFTENSGLLNSKSFQIMEEFPDTSYLEVLLKYGRRWYFLHSVALGHDRFVPPKYFHAIASYKRKEVAELFPLLVKRTEEIGCCGPDYKDYLYEAFWKYRCAAYDSIIATISPHLADSRKSEIEGDTIKSNRHIHSGPPFHWCY